MTEDKLTLPSFFTLLYFADVATSLAAIMIWGDFPDTNVLMIAWINSILMWIMFKILVYLLIMVVFRYLNRYSKYAENILTSITVVYGVLLLNSLANVTMQVPVFDICPEFYRSIEMSKIDVIP